MIKQPGPQVGVAVFREAMISLLFRFIEESPLCRKKSFKFGTNGSRRFDEIVADGTWRQLICDAMGSHSAARRKRRMRSAVVR